MTKEIYDDIASRIEQFSYSSLNYKDYEDIKDAEVLCNNDEAVVLVGTKEEMLEVNFAANKPEPILEVLNTLKEALYIEFIPEAFLEMFEANKFRVSSQFVDFFNEDVHAIALEEASYESAMFLKPQQYKEASKVTCACKNHSRGFNGETPSFFEEWLEEEHSDVLIVEENGRISGLCCVRVHAFDNAKGPIVWVRELAVRPDCRGKGYGKKLIGQALSYGAHKGAKRGHLACDTKNENAIGLYEKYGFVRKEEWGQVNMIRTKSQL